MTCIAFFQSLKKVDQASGNTDLRAILYICLATLVTHSLVPASVAADAVPATSSQTAVMIPELNWVPRSDWINVKTDVKPGAVGDGKADDTAALQNALYGVKSGTTIYIPPGKYRITKTLDFDESRPSGVSIIGHGRSTIIQWDGEVGERMLWVHGGAVHSRYVGLTWDGNDKASVGVDHASKTFETEVMHLHEAFLNFTAAGIRIGYQDKDKVSTEKRLESAEMEFNNCLFDNCRRGVAILNFNDYDNTFDGCEFRRCGIGIQDTHGNVYVRDSHFELSSIADISVASEHSSSVRRCTSTGSFQFLELLNPIVSLAIQDCHISGWKSAEGAISLNGGPVMLYDCSFADSDGGGTPVQLANNEQRLILSNNRVIGGGRLMKGEGLNCVTSLPDGKRGGVIQSSAQRFLKETVTLSTKIFDAKEDFGASGDGTTDDTEAIQKAIDAARQYGQGAIAYLPTGKYVVQKTLKITGANYTVSGSGYRTCLNWKGDPAGTMISIVDPDHIALEYINVASHHDAINMVCDVDVHQTSTGKPSFITYNHVMVYGMYQKKPGVRGLLLSGLSRESTVHMRHVQGNLRFRNAAQATILADTSYEGSISVDGKDKARDGFLGFQMRLSTLTTHGLYVSDNHSIVLSDYYIEQADDGCLIQGSDGDPEGRIVIQGAKMQSHAGPITVENYSGSILIGHNQFYGAPNPSAITVRGNRALDLILAANVYYNTVLDLRNENPHARVYFVGNQQRGQVKGGKVSMGDKFNDRPSEEAALKTSLMLDELRRLGQLDIELNYPEILKTNKP